MTINRQQLRADHTLTVVNDFVRLSIIPLSTTPTHEQELANQTLYFVGS